MRPIWNGALSFGLINIPIRVYSGSEEHGIEFDMLHKKDLSPIRYAKICKAEEKEISYEDIVKGYEFAKGKYVVIEDQDFKNASIKKTQTIEIQSFSFIDEIDPLFFEKPYFLEPEKNSSKAYTIFRDALAKSKKVAIVTYVFRNKQKIGVIQSYGDALVLNQMRYAAEIRSLDTLSLPAKGKENSKEIKMALKLIDQLTEPFEPEKYQDTYTEELKAVIADKLKGKKPSRKTENVQYTKTTDLMDLLKESLHKSLKTQEKVKKAKPKPEIIVKSPKSTKKRQKNR